MRAVLLFSAVLHLAALGFVAAYAVRAWFGRKTEPHFNDTARYAAALGGAVLVLVFLFASLGRGAGPALTTGLVAGVLAAAAFLLGLGAIPHPNADGSPPSRNLRLAGAGFVAMLVLTEIVAFVLLAGAIARSHPYA